MNLELEREQVVQQLCAHYVQDHLTTGELESRFERVHQSADRAALRTVLDGLPALGPLVAPPTSLYALATARGATMVPKQRYAAFFSSVTKEGHWAPGPLIESMTIMGTVKLDLREAEIPAEGLEMDVNAILGTVEIILPPGIGADVDCIAMLGDVSDKSHAGAPGAPHIRIRGGAFMGNIKVKTQLPKKARMESWRAQLNAWFGNGKET